MWEAIGLVSSALTLVAFLAALVARTYQRSLRQQQALIESASKSERAKLVSTLAGAFEVDTSRLTEEQAYDVVIRQIDARQARYRTSAIVVVILAVLFLALASVAIIKSPVPPWQRLAGGATGLTTDDLLERLYGIAGAAHKEQIKKNMDVLVRSFATDPIYLAGTLEATEKLEITGFVAVYFQGREDFLKLQSFRVPVGARKFGPRAYGDDTTKKHLHLNWVFIEEGDTIRQLPPKRVGTRFYWPLTDADAGKSLFVVAAYRGARPYDDRVTDIWIEIDELAGRVEELSIFYGGSVSLLALRDVYVFPPALPLHFHKLPDERWRAAGDGHRGIVDTFSGVFGNFDDETKVKASGSGQEKWSLALQLWRELEQGEGHEWAGAVFEDADQDLLLITTGEYAESG